MLGLTLKQLEAFVCVADCGSFYEAALRLYVSQPTVSSHIAALEKRFGLQLLERGSRKKVTLTEAGREIYGRANEILQSCRALEEDYSGQDSELRLGASTIPMGYILPPILAAFQKQEPGCRFVLKKGDSGDVYRMLDEGRIQLGIVGAVPEREDLARCRFCSDELVFLTPNTAEYRTLLAAPVYGKTLLDRPLIVRGAGSGTQRAVDRYLDGLALDRKQLHVVATVETNEAALELVAQGVGCTVLSSLAAQAWVQAGRVLSTAMDAQPLERELYLVWQKKAGLTRLAQRFVAQACQHVRS